MTNELKMIAAFGVAAVLAGCASTPADPGLTSYAEVDAAMAAMANPFLDSGGDLLDVDDATSEADINVAIAADATATYNGFVGGELSGGGLGGRILVGELELTADFGAGSISATADNFYDSTLVEYDGTLTTVADGGIDAAGAFTMNALLSGDLDNGVDPAYATGINLDGWFIGDTYGTVGGWADISMGGGSAEGRFIAEQ